MKLNDRPEWKCGNCGKTYTFDEFLELDHGICSCGYRFSLDRWRLHDTLKININDKDVGILVSTVFLELNHGFDKDLWYETMIFPEEEGIKCNYEERYEKKDEAIKDHNRILNNLKQGKYIVEKNTETYIIIDKLIIFKRQCLER